MTFARNSLTIEINKPPSESFYMPGETITGSLIVDIASDQYQCEFLNLVFEGKASVKIVEKRTHSHTSRLHYREHTNRFNFTAEEIYFSSVIPVLQQGYLLKGRTVFPIQYTIPLIALPCTIEAKHGGVSYTILAHLKGYGNEVREKLPFIIGPYLDLNTVPLDNFMLTNFEARKEVGGCCSCRYRGSNMVKVQVTIPKRFFIPGECIEFSLVTENKSKKTLGESSMQLVLVITCHAQGNSKQTKKYFDEVTGPEVEPGCVETWDGDDELRVPDFLEDPIGMPPSGWGGCKIIEAAYELRYSASLEGRCCRGTVEINIPVIVGTILPITYQTSPEIIQESLVT